MQNMELNVEALEDLESPWNWNHFFAGVGVGVALVGIAVT